MMALASERSRGFMAGIQGTLMTFIALNCIILQNSGKAYPRISGSNGPGRQPEPESMGVHAILATGAVAVHARANP